jgi:hypothetical protein
MREVIAVKDLEAEDLQDLIENDKIQMPYDKAEFMDILGQ